MPEEIKKPGVIDRSIACEACRALAGSGGFVKVTRVFRTPNVSGIGTVQWGIGLTCRILLSPPSGNESGEWGYGKHAYLEHPEARKTYALLCAVREKVGRKDVGGRS